jgi:hypothetical protein
VCPIEEAEDKTNRNFNPEDTMFSKSFMTIRGIQRSSVAEDIETKAYLESKGK